MKNLQLIGLFLVVAGSFLPLVHIPIVGNWSYWKVDNTLAIAVWGFSLLTLVFILINKTKFVKIMAFLMILLFVFTIVAIKLKSLDYFSFLPFKSWQSTFAGIVKLSWGWFIEFLGVALILISSLKNTEPQRHKDTKIYTMNTINFRINTTNLVSLVKKLCELCVKKIIKIKN